MKHKLLFIAVTLFLLISPFISTVKAQTDTFSDIYEIKISPIPCNKRDPSLSCPVELNNPTDGSTSIYETLGETCATSYEEFLKDPVSSHYWVEDPKITEQGKADERARQFLYWVLSTDAVDQAPVLGTIWSTTAMIAFFGVVIVAAIFGIGYIVSRRTNYNFNIQIWPTVIKLGMMLLYIAFSSAIVFLLIQLSEVMMSFFIDTLGGSKLFNIYFSTNPDTTGSSIGQTERSYMDFIGCRDLNIRVQEGINAEIFLLKLTNVTYYVMGVMLILRKILLWFLLFVSPFLALLMPFVLIRNIGWIWIGVFFQWLFYGPLLALFLYANSTIWENGIPFGFDFSRTGSPNGYVYPTGIIITYGGPAQKLANSGGQPIGALNNGNYIDTFAEYVITLIMLWAVTFFPWWLLRIFRDYCCEGIYAMKNILMAMYDQMRGPSKGPSPSTPPNLPSLKLDTDIPVNTNVNVSLGSMEQIKKTLTRDLTKNLNLQATKMIDIARMETNQQTKQIVNQNLTYLSQPAKLQKPAERQQFMNLRSELFARAIKSDAAAQHILGSISTSESEKIRVRQEIIKSLPQTVTVSVEQITGTETKVSKERIKTITNNYTKNIVNNNETIENIAKTTNVSKDTVKNILNTYSSYTSMPAKQVMTAIAKENNTTTTIVKNILTQSGAMGKYAGVVERTSVTQQLPKEQVTKIISSISSFTTTTIPTVIEKITQKATVPAETVKQFITNTYNNLLTDQSKLQQVSQQTNISAPQVQSIVRSYVTNIDKPQNTVIENISKENNVDAQTVTRVMQASNQILQSNNVVNTMAQQQNIATDQATEIINTIAEAPTVQTTAEEKQPIVKVIAYKSNVSEDKSKNIIQNIMTEASKDTTMISNVQQQTGLQPQQIQNVIQTFSQNVNQPAETIIQQIHETAGIPKDKVQSVLQTTANTVLAANNVVDEVAKQEGVSAQDVANTIETEMNVTTAPDEHIEKTITIPQSVSIEDYEQVKDMWTKHYEEGEIPVSETIQTRQDWISQEIVYITNTLNKILSSDETLRQEGLDELGFLLPIFLINNLKGEELIVYLKAKLEAAKLVQKILKKEDDIKKNLKKEEDEEVFVDIKKEQEEAQPLHMDLDTDQDKAPQSIEDRVQAVQEKLEDIHNETEAPLSMDEIKNKLQQQSEKDDEMIQ